MIKWPFTWFSKSCDSNNCHESSSTAAPSCPSTATPSDSSECPRVDASSDAGCPASSSSSCSPDVDPRNMMPVIPNQSADALDLSKDRERSNIPKTGSDEKWVYPSPQQFYNALLRKNKDVAESDLMDSVVFAHNVTNEKTWEDIMRWEAMHFEQCKDPSLLRFVGRSEDLTPRAWFSYLFLPRGTPFDRHDWYVDRCGTPIRYVIDYYDDPNADNELEISLDTRPALDSFQNAWDRIRFRWTAPKRRT
eukprot:GEMP01055538.1.p1 GENE.GEMP01055538.1~~GEMP01055538.1.p1  ORF type:complete len:249 (+),score=48.33 GEMP01055538.1:31-777(+)